MRHRWPVILPPEPLELGGASSSGPKPAGFAEKNPTFECRATPRASATPATTRGMAHCVKSASADSVGRRRLRTPMPISCTYSSLGSTRRATFTVRTLFSCVASRNRCRCPAGRHPACFRGHSVKPSGPYPLGKNQSLSSPPLMPRGHLLSAMRQKVSKDRSQGGSAPLAIPRRNCPNLAKPSCGPTPAAFAEKTPAFECRAAPRAARGGGGSRDSLSRSCSTCRPIRKESSSSGAVPLGTRTGQPLPQAEDGDSTSRDTAPPFSAQIFPLRTDATRRTGLLLENRDRRSRAPPPPPAEGATSLLLRRLRGRL